MSCVSESAFSRRRDVLRAAAAVILATLVLPVGVASQTRSAYLRSVEVTGTNDVLVITLTADGPISGRLQRITTGQPRLYLDLQRVRPQVDALTPVNRGPVLRIRIGLHSAEPPVTRVVLDVSDGAPSRLERGTSDRQLRIIVGEGEVAPEQTAVQETSSSRTRIDLQWCAEFAERLEAAMAKQTPSTSQPAMLAALAEWDAVEREVERRRLSPDLQPIGFMLLQATRLGRIAATHRNAREFDQANAAYAGARLLVNTARTRIAELTAKS